MIDNRIKVLAQAKSNLDLLMGILNSKRFYLYQLLQNDKKEQASKFKKIKLEDLSDQQIDAFNHEVLLFHQSIVNSFYWRVIDFVGEAKNLVKSNSKNYFSKLHLIAKKYPSTYERWLQYHDKVFNNRKNINKVISEWCRPSLISIVVYPGNLQFNSYIKSFISVWKQTYSVWEVRICLIQKQRFQIFFWNVFRLLDSRIEVLVFPYLTEMNRIDLIEKGAQSSEGRWVAYLESGDLLAKNCLYHIAKCDVENPEATIIFGDEDRIAKNGTYESPIFKQPWNPPLFYSYHYFGSLPFYRRDVYFCVGRSEIIFPGQDFYDLSARIIEEYSGSSVRHVPIVCSHHSYERYKNSPTKSKLRQNSRKKVIQSFHQRNNISARVSHSWGDNLNRISYCPPLPLPLISILIPIRDKVSLLEVCINSIFLKTTYPNFEIIVMDNGSVEGETIEFLQTLIPLGVKILRIDEPFNYSRMNNKASELSKGEYLCLLNNDIEIISDNWLEEMLMYACQDWVGCVGAKLWYPDNKIQHAGVVLGIGGTAAHAYKLTTANEANKIRYLNVPQAVGAVTGACLMVQKTKFQLVGGLDESLAVAFNDVDFCIKLNQQGLKNVWTPYSELFHYESVSRGYEDTPEKKIRFNREKQILKAKWDQVILTDPFYSPLLSKEKSDFSFSWRLEDIT